jgi:hypothetical protein
MNGVIPSIIIWIERYWDKITSATQSPRAGDASQLNSAISMSNSESSLGLENMGM